jgi:hypothetical protein
MEPLVLVGFAQLLQMILPIIITTLAEIVLIENQVLHGSPAILLRDIIGFATVILIILLPIRVMMAVLVIMAHFFTFPSQRHRPFNLSRFL